MDCFGKRKEETEEVDIEQPAQVPRNTDSTDMYNGWPVGSSGRRNGRGRRNSDTATETEPWNTSVYIPDVARDPIRVKGVDFHVGTNTRAHHTDEYDITQPRANGERELLVVRRGQTFEVGIEFDRPYKMGRDPLMVVFRFGKNPKPTISTHVQISPSDKLVSGQWGAAFSHVKDFNVVLTIMTPEECLVGKWTMSIEMEDPSSSGRGRIQRFQFQDPIYILFNPWSKGDPVYMHSSQLLYEYVLNQTGRIYSGNSSSITYFPWAFGQFSGNVLDCCLYLLDKAGIKDYARGDPILIVRRLSALVNSNDDKGVVVGNWSGQYGGGKSPLAWTGSAAILERYYRTKQPVKYGQCWTFAGVTATVCRALGIPTRCVSNFASAHDTDGSITIDSHFDKWGRPLDYLDSDSIWNFHVWNDVWMARPDLPSAFSGWQAIDSTPQETSDGIFCMGPVSVNALKQGEVAMPYDGPFAFAEVNADRVMWRVNDDGTAEVLRISKNSIGKHISTKRPFQDVREDISDQYKHPEGSEEERAAVYRANLHSTLDAKIYQKGPQDVQFDLEPIENTYVGEEITVTLQMTNRSNDVRTISGTLTIASIYYTGVYFRNIANTNIGGEVVKPGEAKSIEVKVEPSAYLGNLVDHCMLKVSCVVDVAETGQNYAEIEEFRLLKPDLTIQAPSAGWLGQEFPFTVSFNNPLPVTLTGGEVMLEAPGILQPVAFPQRDVQANGTFAVTFNIMPTRTGEKELIAVYNSNQISSIRGTHVIKISQ